MKKVLLIEDEETSCELAKLALQRLGHTDITCAADGAHGLKLFDRMDPAPDVVISDIYMPNKDGIEIVNSLVARKYAGGVILLSGGDHAIISLTKLFARSGGLNLLGVLRKPLDEQALAHALEATHTPEVDQQSSIENTGPTT
jgi:YesN/AraC family two-component response regulator